MELSDIPTKAIGDSSFKEMWDLDDRKCVQCVGNARKTLAAKRQTNNG